MGLTSSGSPSVQGQPVTYTATVNSTNGAPAPVGSVTFTDNGNPITCAPGSAPFSGATATCIVTYSSTGVHPVTATFVPTNNTNYTTKLSVSLTQVVQSPASCVNAAITGTPTTTITGTYSGNLVVSMGTVWLNGGTITGNVTVAPAGTFSATGGTVGGSVSSTGGPVSLQGTKVLGNVTSSGGGLAIGPGSALSGNVTASGARPVCIGGTSTQRRVTVQGNVSVQGLSTSTTQNTFCGLSLNGNFTYQSNAEPAEIAGASPCPGSVTMHGNLVVQSNKAAVTIGGSGYGNAVTGNITVSSNTGGGSVVSNSAGGNCSLSGDSPAITGSVNTANGHNACNGSA